VPAFASRSLHGGRESTDSFHSPEPNPDTFLLPALIKRVEPGSEPGVTNVGLQFVDVKDIIRDKLCRSVFCRQRELIKKGFYELEDE